MTVTSSTNRADYKGNGSTTAFTVPFRFLDATHLTVVRTVTETGAETTLVKDTDYTVSGTGGATGTVTLMSALASGTRLTIVRNVPLTQLANYVNGEKFPAGTTNAALDKLTMALQQFNEVLARTVSFSVGYDGGILAAEDLAARLEALTAETSSSLFALPVSYSLPDFYYGEFDGSSYKIPFAVANAQTEALQQADLDALADRNGLWAAILPSVSVTPTVTGTLLTTNVLTANYQTWVGLTPLTYEYQWLRDGAEINAATASTYTLDAADQMTFISCEFAVSNVAGTNTYTVDYGWCGQLYTFYNDISNAAWTKYQCTVSGGGTSTQRILETAVNDLHRFRQDKGKAASSLTYRFMAKVAGGLGRDWCHVEAMSGLGTNGVVIFFDLVNGVIGNAYEYGSGFAFVGAYQRIYRAGDGYWWIVVDFTTDDDTDVSVRLGPASADDVNSYAGDITKGLYVDQLVLGLKP